MIISARVRTHLENCGQSQNCSFKRRWTSQDSKLDFIWRKETTIIDQGKHSNRVTPEWGEGTWVI